MFAHLSEPPVDCQEDSRARHRHVPGGAHTSGPLNRLALRGARVKKGQRVLRGDGVGDVGPGRGTSLPPNVHLSARRNNVYFDPLELYVGTSYADLVELVA